MSGHAPKRSGAFIASRSGKMARRGAVPRWMAGKGVQPKNTPHELQSWIAQEEAPLAIETSSGSGMSSASTSANATNPGTNAPVREKFLGDQMDSDNEHARDYTEEMNEKVGKLVENVMEAFFSDVLRWKVHPRDSPHANLVNGNADWVDFWAKTIAKDILQNAVLAEDPSEYRKHWSAFLLAEVRAGIREGLKRTYPDLFNTPDAFLSKLRDRSESPAMYRFIVRKSNNSRMLTNISSDSTDATLNSDVAMEMAGMTVCVGYLQKEEAGRTISRLPMSLILSRSVHLEGEDVDKVGLSGKIDYLRVKLSLDRRLVSRFSIDEEDVIYLKPIYSLASIARMLQSMAQLARLPTELHRLLYRLGGKSQDVNSRRSQNVQSILEELDPAAARYIARCNLTAGALKMNDRQMLAVCRVLRDIGSGERGRFSINLLLGPPATGKTTCIINTIGAVMHHSKVGHVKKPQFNVLNKDDGLVRASKNEDALRILVCCGSNQATCNVMRRIHKNGIPDGEGGTIKPKMVRIARQGFEYGDLKEHSLNEAALSFDDGLYHVDQKGTRTSASLCARRALAKECVIFFMTLSLSGSARLKELRVPIDLILIDEAAQSFEPEVLVPMVATRKISATRRLHVAMFGDPKQLAALSLGRTMISECGVHIPFDYEKQTVSLFERVMSQGSASLVLLNMQYRMHSYISNNVLPLCYEERITNAVEDRAFKTAYNQGGSGYAPLVVLDTSKCISRGEQDGGEGKISNRFECAVIMKVMERIVGISDHGDLKGRITIIAPYAAQVEELKKVIESDEVTQSLNVEVSTVDSMQGREKDIIIFSGTRSNDRRRVGFLRDRRRLNVSMTRAMRLSVFVMDVTTMCDGAIPSMNRIVGSAKRGTHGAQYKEVRIEGEEVKV